MAINGFRKIVTLLYAFNVSIFLVRAMKSDLNRYKNLDTKNHEIITE